MTWKLFILFAILALVIYFIKHLPVLLQSSMRLPYVKREALFSPAEKLFLDALEKAIDGQYKIYGKVRLADIMDVRNNLSAKNKQIALNGISSKHIDFVLCNEKDASIVCGIELDDKSHNQSNRIRRDEFVDKSFEAADLPLFRFKAKSGYDVEEIRTQILKGLGALKSENVAAPSEKVEGPKEGVCPKCSGPMTRKKASAGENAGKVFWVCNNYQTCKTAVAAD
jgi:ssDNA-binding Zn-finger/Zn-ribbon topoisomerase 1